MFRLRKPVKSPFNILRTLRHYRRAKRVIRDWREKGSPAPPPHPLKQQVVRAYRMRFDLQILIETGTYCGDMIYAVADDFAEVHSIELGQELYEKARRRFAPFGHIHLHQGDSTTVLPKILGTLRAPALFWLDGHYSEGITACGDKKTPIVEELEAIYRHNPTGNVILIDDARLFVGVGDYPTIDEIRRLILRVSPQASMEVSDDIIRLHSCTGG